MNTENKNGQTAKEQNRHRGFYLVLAVCIIAIAGIVFAVMPPAEKAQNTETELSDVQKIDSPTLEEEEKERADAQQQAQASAAPSPSVTVEASPETQSSTVPQNMQRAELSILKPMSGAVSGEFQIDKLVFNSTLNIWQTHSGVDIVPDDQSEVCAALAGEVTGLVEDPSMGTLLTITHSDGIVTKYAGLSEVRVAQGDKVSKGDAIGVCGTPPFEAHMGTHLHFEVWDGSKPVDPQEVFE